MRILQVCQRYAPYIGGLEEHVRNISERLAKYSDVSVATTDPSGDLPEKTRINGVEILRFKSWAPNEAYFLSATLKRFLRENSDNFDVVHAHCYHAFPALYAAQAAGKNRFVFTPHYHGEGHTFFRSVLHFPYKFLGRGIFEKAHRIICVSAYEKSLILTKFRIDSSKIVIIPNGIDNKEFENLRKSATDHRVILYVGRLEKYKGVHLLIKVLQNLDKNVLLEIVGTGPYKSSLIRLAQKSRVEERVKFYQNLSRKELLARYATADVFALLSRHEAFGISVAEALASRLPCIVAKTSALQEWVDDKNCFGIDYPIDLNRLANLVHMVIGKQISNVSLPSWDDVARRTAEVYDACLS